MGARAARDAHVAPLLARILSPAEYVPLACTAHGRRHMLARRTTCDRRRLDRVALLQAATRGRICRGARAVCGMARDGGAHGDGDGAAAGEPDCAARHAHRIPPWAAAGAARPADDAA